ncbi:MAG: glutamine--fructose-6-phosphate transaminase (isomerizing) [Mariprofundaceae bacterium]
MCGIIGAVSGGEVQDALLDALKRMEYRGYDSAGICLRDQNRLNCRKEAGKLINLEQSLSKKSLKGHAGIGHTRWATHGGPSRENAHPHLADGIAVVHNGIIENHQDLRQKLTDGGAVFHSETDSEVIPWLLSSILSGVDKTIGMADAWRQTVDQLQGAYAMVALTAADDGCLWFARRGSPLLIGRGADGVFAASDALALAGLADEVIYLEEGDIGSISLSGVDVFQHGIPVQRDWQPIPVAEQSAGKDGFDHFMQKEIFEQPRVVADIMHAYVQGADISFPAAPLIDNAALPNRIVMVACGTSYHAALTARYWLERYLQVSVEVDVASEYRYRDPVIGPDTWLITLSQSGETADTLEALRLFKLNTPDNLALTLCNVPESSLARESDGTIPLLAGVEIGVASTKAYTAQLAVLALLVLKIAYQNGVMTEADTNRHLTAMREVVDGMQVLLGHASQVQALTPLFEDIHGALFLGRGPFFPLALEGALKLKEISYLHAEGYAAGEMKHGPIALIDSRLPVVVLAARKYHLQKVLSNLREVQARGAKVILLTDMRDEDIPDNVNAVIPLPEGDSFTTPLFAAIPLQLLAYYVACARGTDVDQPRNLAKSVTVE